jgi:hypothetical protein
MQMEANMDKVTLFLTVVTGLIPANGLPAQPIRPIDQGVDAATVAAYEKQGLTLSEPWRHEDFFFGDSDATRAIGWPDAKLPVFGPSIDQPRPTGELSDCPISGVKRLRDIGTRHPHPWV